MNKTELVIQLLKIAIGNAFAASPYSLPPTICLPRREQRTKIGYPDDNASE
jgi:hypothetical protein